MAIMSAMVVLPHVLEPTSAILMSCLLYACVDPCNEQAQRSVEGLLCLYTRLEGFHFLSTLR